MIQAAQAAAPEVDAQTIARILEAAMKGTFVLEVDAGQQINAGKSVYPAYATLIFKDPLRALDVAQNLLIGANNALARRKTEFNLDLMLPGDGAFED